MHSSTKRLVLASSLVLGALALTSTASAQVPVMEHPAPEAQPAPASSDGQTVYVIEPAEPAPALEDPTAEYHEGFYFRVALGAGALVDSFNGPFGIWDGHAEGGSGSFELALGGSLAPGLVLGGAVMVEQVVDPKVTINGAPASESDNVSVGTFVLVGPFLDWYPSPEGGFHLQGMVGGARIELKDSEGVEREDHHPIGGGAAIGAGYEFWIADEFSLGILGRIGWGTMRDDDVTHHVGTFSALVTLTYN